MPNPVNGVAGPSAERTVSAVEAALEARERRAERARQEERVAEARGTGSAARTSEDPAVQNGEAATAADRILPYRVTLDPQTKHLYTEVLDTTTGEVVLRIPPRYVDPEDVLDPEPSAAEEARDDEDGSIEA